MKWNMLIGSLMLGASLCTPSFGGGLLDRLLGLKGSGCDSSCCDSGAAAAPSCGCEINACDPCAKKGCGLLSKLKGPSCGCEINACDPCGCDSGCGKKKGLLSKLFAKKACCDTGCDTGCTSGCSSCGGSATPAPAPAPAAASAAPMPPAPVVDPSAYLNSNRRVIQATSYVR